jgi:hypothetical protein
MTLESAHVGFPHFSEHPAGGLLNQIVAIGVKIAGNFVSEVEVAPAPKRWDQPHG